MLRIKTPFLVALLFISLVLWCTSFPAYSKPKSPSKVWLLLGYPTRDQDTVDWPWIERQARQGQIIKAFRPIRDKVKAIVVPIFGVGQCFYETQIKPFAGRNKNALLHESYLHDLCQAAQKSDIPVYLEVNTLGWGKRTDKASGGTNSIFDTVPSWEERGKTVTSATAYASPFHSEVRASMELLVLELAVKFPEANGIMLNHGLSGQEILGYNSVARRISQTELGIDPMDLSLKGTASESYDENTRQWIQWRNIQMLSFLESLSGAFRQVRPSGTVFTGGLADYYKDDKEKEFNDLRRAQDWRYWIQQGAVDGVLVEGNWQPRYMGEHYFSDSLEKVAELSKAKGKKITLIPVSRGQQAGNGSDYARDWTNLKTYIPALDEIAFVIGNEQDLQNAIAVASGKAAFSRFEAPRVGQLLPEFFLPDEKGENWMPSMEYGKNGLLLLIGENAKIRAGEQAILEHWRQVGVQPILVSGKPLRKSSGLKYVIDAQRELVHWFPDGNGAVLVDRAGFIREMGAANGANWPKSLQNPYVLPSGLKEGDKAPGFVMRDMTGQAIRLSDFRAKKHVLITFFPRCFTGGCKQHLASLQANEDILERNDLAIIAVSVDPPDLQRAFAASLGARFPFITDVGRNLCLLYGATENTTDLASRMSVLIDKDGTVRWIEKHIHIATHGEDVLAKMRELGMTP